MVIYEIVNPNRAELVLVETKTIMYKIESI
jgi:hypothetical protein